MAHGGRKYRGAVVTRIAGKRLARTWLQAPDGE